MTDSNLISKGPCEHCGSSDARCTYDDGHSFCFACPEDTAWQAGDEDVSTPKKKGARVSGLIPNDELEVSALPSRKLSEETCRRYGYFTATVGDLGKVHVAVYRDADGSVVGHKLRTRSKDFLWKGEPNKAALFGQHLARTGGRRIAITEGEIDALSLSQALVHKYPVVSVPNGAGGAKRDISKQLDFLNTFDDVILCFDNDEAGQRAISVVAPLFPPGKVKVMTLPRKDPNEMLKADEAGVLVEAYWNAKQWRHDGIKALADVRAEIMKAPVWGLPWWTDWLTKKTFGRRMGECVALGAGTGIGKTDFITQQVAYDITVLREKVGLFFLEQLPSETGKRIAGKVSRQRFHIPDAGWTVSQLSDTLDKLDADKGLFFYDHFGSCDWERIRDTIRVMHHSEGIRLFYLDHLTALAAEEEDERKALERIMAQLGGLVKEMPIWLLFVSHLATPEGKSHEEGGRVMAKHFKGSRAIQFWAHFMFGLERDNQAEDAEERKTTTLRILKDRYTGLSTGHTHKYGYDDVTGLLEEKGDDPVEPDDTDEETPF